MTTTEAKIRKTDDERAAELEAKAQELRKRASRRKASEKNKSVRSMLYVSRALARLAKSYGGEHEQDWLMVASDLERRADAMIGQSRVDG